MTEMQKDQDPSLRACKPEADSERPPSTPKPWHMTAQPRLSLYDRVRFLFGVPLFVRFKSPDGDCHAACSISAGVYKDWPENTSADLKGWPMRNGGIIKPASEVTGRFVEGDL